jgi:Tc toxin complex TcA C-terminal TcB-binding domain
VWRLFADADAANPADVLQLLPHLAVPLDHNDLVQRYFGLTALLGGPELTARNLVDERWPVRAWHAEQFLSRVLTGTYATGIAGTRPDLWVADDPSAGTPSGNDDLTRYVGDAVLETGDPRRYRDLLRLDDGLRERARRALVAYLCGLDRVQLPGGPPAAYASGPDDLSDLLLLDVSAGLAERATRVDDAITAVQAFVRRALLGLEPGVHLGHAFRQVWAERFATFRIWQACKRRELYPEDTIECDELERARRHEAFRLLEAELRDASLSVPVPAGIQYWDGHHPAPHACLTVLQAAQPSTLHLPVGPDPGGAPAGAAAPTENFGLLGRPDRTGRPSWLSPVRTAPQPVPVQPAPSRGPQAKGRSSRAGTRTAKQAVVAERVTVPAPGRDGRLPYWIEAAVGLGVRFLRIAAAGEPAGSALPEPERPGAQCCRECGAIHPPRIDEYYFWLARADYYDIPGAQDADLTNASGGSQWEDPATFPALLDWAPEPMAHLHWCQVHDGEFGQLRRSAQGVVLTAAPVTPGSPTLELLGRMADSLVFTVDDGTVPVSAGDGGFTWRPPYAGWTAEPGWRYDLAVDDALLLPLITTPTVPMLQPPVFSQPPANQPPGTFGGLSAYPFFVYGTPGESLLPLSRYAPATLVGGTLRCHCKFEDALRWYERYYDPFTAGNQWTAGPPDPGLARRRAVLLDVLETLLCWGDAVMATHSECGPPAGDSPETAAQARVIYAAARRVLGPTPVTVLEEPPSGAAITVGTFSPLDTPLNPRLMTLYLRTADRLELVREWENRHRRRRGELGTSAAFWGDDPARWGHDDECGCGACEHCGECACCEPGSCAPGSPYRYDYLQPKALELAGELRGLGAELLAAYEKGDAEFLESLRSTQQHQLEQLTLAVRKDQWRDADWQVQALKQALLSAQRQVAYYQTLASNGLISNETAYQDLSTVAEGLQVGAQGLEIGIQFGSVFMPDIFVGEDNFIRIPGSGTNIVEAITAGAKALEYLAQDMKTQADLALTEAGWDRRAVEWNHQIEIYGIEVERLTREVLGAERLADSALRELNIQHRTIEQAHEIDDFLRGKFTSHALYLFLQRRMAALYREAYELALAVARQAERAFNLERGRTGERFITGEWWDSLYQGLLAGERLALDLRRMDQVYRDCDRREYELTKAISLQRDFPLAFLKLKLTGRCELELPEWLFDADYPGFYLRRLKTVALTIPVVAGPYTGVHCRLTLLGSATRTQPWLSGPVARCCHGEEERCDCCDDHEHRQRADEADRYRPLPGDPRIVRSFTATDAIATSTGTSDSGLFQLSFRDERYLPFEYAGAVSHWRIELPPENNQFGFDTLTDVVMQVSYTAREGGDRLRGAAAAAACSHLPGDGLRLFTVRQEFPDAWPGLRLRRDPDRRDDGDRHNRHLRLRFGQRMFPFVPGRRVRWIDRLVLVFAAPGTEPGRHHLVRFWRDGDDAGHVTDVECVATGALAGYFVGVIDLSHPLGPLGEDHARCTFAFSDAAGEICDAYIVAHYRADCWPRCGPPREDGCDYRHDTPAG